MFYEYNPPASYYEPPDVPEWDEEEERVIEDEFMVIFQYDDGYGYSEILNEKEIAYIREDIDEYKEEGLISLEICEVLQNFGISYGKHEDEYYIEEIGERYNGEVLSFEKF